MHALKRLLSWRSLACVVLASVVLAGCASDFSRGDAIVALQTTGVSEAEATCMADSLTALEQLDAANPAEPRTDERRSAFVAASTRCIKTEVLTSSLGTGDDGSVGASLATVQGVIEASTSIETGTASEPGTSDGKGEADASAAIAELQRQGRTEANATCIVEFLTGAQATHLFLDPNFGLGLDALEANAIAACLSQR